MIEIGKIRGKALDSLERRLMGNVWIALLVCVVLESVIVGVPSLLGSVCQNAGFYLGAFVGVPMTFATILLAGPMAYGVARVFHRLAREGGKPEIAEVFCAFREEVGESFLLGFLRSLFIFLWSLLLIVPGIVKAYAYSMAFFIQQEAKNKQWRDSLDESAELMRGYKGKLFLLDLSFIGWYLVGLLCLGVGVLWVQVYHTQARAHFYEEVKRIKFGDLAKEEPDVQSESAEEDERDFEERYEREDAFDFDNSKEGEE